MKPITPQDWQLSGDAMISDAQRRLLNAACGDLEQMNWFGHRLSKDDWRHFVCGHILGWRMMPAIDMGDGARGFIMLGGSSLSLTRTKATEAITTAFYIGDAPHEQGLSCKPVIWCSVVLGARGIRDSDDELARRFAA